MLKARLFFIMKDTSNAVELFKTLNAKAFYLQHPRPVIIAENMRTPENIGAIMRLAGNIGAEKILFVTESPFDFKTWKIKRTASGAYEKTNWQITDPDTLKLLIPTDYRLIALETTDKAKNIYALDLPAKTAFIVGNEQYGISQQLLNIADEVAYIPLPGEIYSLNVTHALSVGLFEWYRQQSLKIPNKV